MNGGYVLLDLTKYGDITNESQIQITKEEFEKVMYSLDKGKPLQAKFSFEGYLYCLYLNTHSDFDTYQTIYCRFSNYDNNDLYFIQFEKQVDNTFTMTIYDVE